ncbi:hypothetical protein [Nonomuraea salmonea]|uniref:hypothetical protein n=1 Tax=Nonomuraea salmonea TaxID=46181 RepID=UPI002FEDE12A
MTTRYAHPLRLGLLLTGATPGTAADLARLAEELGYDLITFQNEPPTSGDGGARRRVWTRGR